MTDDEFRAIEDQAEKWKDCPGIEGTLGKLLVICLEEIRRLARRPCVHEIEAQDRARDDSGYF